MKYTELKNVCRINMGQSPESSSYNESGVGLPFFQGNADFGNKHPITRVWCNSPTKIAHADDILISVRAPIGALNYAKEDCCIGRGLAAITPDKTRFSVEFIFWLLKGKTAELNSKGTGSTFKAIGRKVLEEIRIPDITFEEQKACAEHLEKVYSVIQNRKRELQSLDTLIKARFVEMFGAYNADCCKKHISDYAQVLGGFAFKSDEFIQDAVPVIRISNISDGSISPDYSICYTKEFWDNNSKYRAFPGDILMAMSGATTGKAGILINNEPLLINQRVACIRAIKGVALPEFLYAVSQLSWMYDLVQEQSAGCAQPNISGKQIANMPVPEASLTKQQEFATFVAQIDKSKFVVQKALDEAQLLFDSLMQQYFGG